MDAIARAALIRVSVANYTGVAYDDLRCHYCGKAFDGSSLEALLADGPVSLGGLQSRELALDGQDIAQLGPSAVACKACYERKHRV